MIRDIWERFATDSKREILNAWAQNRWQEGGHLQNFEITKPSYCSIATIKLENNGPIILKILKQLDFNLEFHIHLSITGKV